jgi:hypothetical protein
MGLGARVSPSNTNANNTSVNWLARKENQHRWRHWKFAFDEWVLRWHVNRRHGTKAILHPSIQT